MSNLAYTVEAHGVTRDTTLGVFATLDDAVACARRLTQTKTDDADPWWADGDGYHDYVVMAWTLGKQPAREVGRFSADFTRTAGLAVYRWQAAATEGRDDA